MVVVLVKKSFMFVLFVYVKLCSLPMKVDNFMARVVLVVKWV